MLLNHNKTYEEKMRIYRNIDECVMYLVLTPKCVLGLVWIVRRDVRSDTYDVAIQLLALCVIYSVHLGQ